MLCISRRLDESIVIAEDIVVRVISIERGKVRLGITAPRDVPIWREELLPVADEAPEPVAT